MLPINDYIVLDFLLWLRRFDINYLFIDRIEYDIKYRKKIESYAKSYLRNLRQLNSKTERIYTTKTILQELLRSFINSKEFDTFCGNYYFNFGGIFQGDIDETVRNFCKKLSNMSVCDAENILLRYYWKHFAYSKEMLNVDYLITSIKSHYSYSKIFQGKEYCKSEVEIVEQFLDYLDEKKVRLNLKTIPRSYLKTLVHRYNCQNIPDEVITDILKERLNCKMATALRERLSNDKLLHYKEMGYLYDRYTDTSVAYKCLLLPLKGETKLDEFISLYWEDLDAASMNYLDIYVSKNDLQLSGHKSMQKLENLKIDDRRLELPCIVIWNELTDAKVINIRGLNFSQLYACRQKIINFIRNEYEIDSIISEAEIFVAKCIEENKKQMVIYQKNN